MRIACLMMQKNERDLLTPWIEYHSNLFGPANIFVFDNGSNDPTTKKILKQYEIRGIHVDYSKTTYNDFRKKGQIISEKIRSLDKSGEYDFFFPLDCDEFVAAEADDGMIKPDIKSIAAALEPYERERRVLMIAKALDNNPVYLDYYRAATDQRKCFFARGACLSLDIGFHNGRAISTDETLKTPIVYFHMHHRPYRAFRYFAMQKLAGRISKFSSESLLEHLNQRRPGFHLITPLLMSEEEFNQFHNAKPAIHAPQFRKRLAELDAPLNFSDDYPDTPTTLDGGGQVKYCRGVIDRVHHDGFAVSVAGWAITPTGKPATVMHLRLGQHDIAKFETSTVIRPDVAKALGSSARESGFEVRFSLLGIPAAALESRTLEVLVGSQCPETLSTYISLGSTKEWPFAGIRPLPNVPDAPAMPAQTLPHIYERMARSKCYLEYGTGGTTVKAAELGVPTIIGVESDSLWLDAVRHRIKEYPAVGGRHLIHADIGPTREWGHPISDSAWRQYHDYPLAPWALCREKKLSPDLVLIDGRFRVACCLATFLFATSGCRVLFDDYLDRSYYFGVEKFVTRSRTIGRIAEFIVPVKLPRDEIWLALMSAITDPR